jgi:hypothetical protein
MTMQIFAFLAISVGSALLLSFINVMKKDLDALDRICHELEHEFTLLDAVRRSIRERAVSLSTTFAPVRTALDELVRQSKELDDFLLVFQGMKSTLSDPEDARVLEDAAAQEELLRQRRAKKEATLRKAAEDLGFAYSQLISVIKPTGYQLRSHLVRHAQSLIWQCSRLIVPTDLRSQADRIERRTYEATPRSIYRIRFGSYDPVENAKIELAREFKEFCSRLKQEGVFAQSCYDEIRSNAARALENTAKENCSPRI